MTVTLGAYFNPLTKALNDRLITYQSVQKLPIKDITIDVFQCNTLEEINKKKMADPLIAEALEDFSPAEGSRYIVIKVVYIDHLERIISPSLFDTSERRTSLLQSSPTVSAASVSQMEQAVPADNNAILNTQDDQFVSEVYKGKAIVFVAELQSTTANPNINAITALIKQGLHAIDSSPSWKDKLAVHGLSLVPFSSYKTKSVFLPPGFILFELPVNPTLSELIKCIVSLRFKDPDFLVVKYKTEPSIINNFSLPENSEQIFYIGQCYDPFPETVYKKLHAFYSQRGTTSINSVKREQKANTCLFQFLQKAIAGSPNYDVISSSIATKVLSGALTEEQVEKIKHILLELSSARSEASRHPIATVESFDPFAYVGQCYEPFLRKELKQRILQIPQRGNINPKDECETNVYMVTSLSHFDNLFQIGENAEIVVGKIELSEKFSFIKHELQKETCFFLIIRIIFVRYEITINEANLDETKRSDIIATLSNPENFRRVYGGYVIDSAKCGHELIACIKYHSTETEKATALMSSFKIDLDSLANPKIPVTISAGGHVNNIKKKLTSTQFVSIQMHTKGLGNDGFIEAISAEGFLNAVKSFITSDPVRISYQTTSLDAFFTTNRTFFDNQEISLLLYKRVTKSLKILDALIILAEKYIEDANRKEKTKAIDYANMTEYLTAFQTLHLLLTDLKRDIMRKNDWGLDDTERNLMIRNRIEPAEATLRQLIERSQNLLYFYHPQNCKKTIYIRNRRSVRVTIDLSGKTGIIRWSIEPTVPSATLGPVYFQRKIFLCLYGAKHSIDELTPTECKQKQVSKIRFTASQPVTVRAYVQNR